LPFGSIFSLNTELTLATGLIMIQKKMIAFAAAAKKFTKENGYNQQTVFFIEMGLPSGSNRFMIYNLIKDSVTDRALWHMAIVMNIGWREENIAMWWVAVVLHWANTE
jgi:hypothetical protein